MTSVYAMPRRGAEARRAVGALRFTRGCDVVLELGLVAFAAWTLLYHACLLAGAGADVAAVLSIVLVPIGWWTIRSGLRAGQATGPQAPVDARGTSEPLADGSVRSRALLPAAAAAVAIVAGVLFAARLAPWAVVWVTWMLAAGAALLNARGRLSAREASSPAADPGWTEVALVGAWAIGLSVFALLLVDPNADDAYYVHLSSWIAAHGRFPLRDVLFADERFPGLFWPPVPAFEALAGTVARVTGAAAPSVVYLAVPVAGSAASVLALWRLLRSWQVPAIPIALSAALVFLLFDAGGKRTLGAEFVGRMWQGKVLFAAVLVPLLLVLLLEGAKRPSRRTTLLLASAGIAGVGLTTTAIFVVPVIVAGAAVAGLVLRLPLRTMAPIGAAAVYPVVTAAVTLALGGRSPEVYGASDVASGLLAHDVLGTGVPALVAVAAVLAGPAIALRRPAAAMMSATTLVVGALLAPGVPLMIFHATGLGRVLWRLGWAIPVAALVGAAAAALVPRSSPRALRALPAVAVAAAMALTGTAVWSTSRQATVAPRPAWKLDADRLARARALLAVARSGDVILAGTPLSITIAAISGDVHVSNARWLYLPALRGVPGARVPERRLLQHFAQDGLTAVSGASDRERAARVRAALPAVGVDLACLPSRRLAARRVLAGAGYARPVLRDDEMTCFRRDGPG